MASYGQKIDNKYGEESYQETKNTYDWIIKAVQKAPFTNIKVSAEFQFDIGKINCVCDSIEEFVEQAYGQSDYSLTTARLILKSDERTMAYIFIGSNRIRIYADTKGVLETIVALLEKTSLNETEINDPISVRYIENQIIVQGDNNQVATNHSTVVNPKSDDKSKLKKCLIAIGQSILANGIWYLLLPVVGALIAYLASR